MRPAAVAAAVALALAGAAPLRVAVAETPPDVVVLCDATLCPAIRAAGELWRAGSRVPVRTFELPTALMAERLAHGVRADLVAGLDPAALDRAEQAGALQPGSRKPLGADRLVLVRRAGAASGAPAAVLGDGRLGLNDAGLPGPGAASRTWLAAIGLTGEAGRLGAENTPAVAGLVATGAARLGVVFATDLKADPSLAAAQAADAPAVAAELATAKGARSANTAAFRDFLLGARGGEALRAAGLEAAP